MGRIGFEKQMGVSNPTGHKNHILEISVKLLKCFTAVLSNFKGKNSVGLTQAGSFLTTGQCSGPEVLAKTLCVIFRHE